MQPTCCVTTGALKGHKRMPFIFCLFTSGNVNGMSIKISYPTLSNPILPYHTHTYTLWLYL